MIDPLHSLLRERSVNSVARQEIGTTSIAEASSETNLVAGADVGRSRNVAQQSCLVPPSQIDQIGYKDDATATPLSVKECVGQSEFRESSNVKDMIRKWEKDFKQSNHSERDIVVSLPIASHDKIDPLSAFLGDRQKTQVVANQESAHRTPLDDHEVPVCALPSVAVQDVPCLIVRRASSSSPRNNSVGHHATSEIRASSSSPLPKNSRCRGPLPSEAVTGGHWNCELCRSPTVPLLGTLARPFKIGQGARHHCRSCGRTVCGGCSVKIDGLRTCRNCNLKTQVVVLPLPHQREKFIFLVRHAKSVWNEAIAAGKRDMLARSWDRDHPLSDFGIKQTQSLSEQVRTALQNFERNDTFNLNDYYNAFFAKRELIYSSPLLRALQTAHLCFPIAEGWGQIKLLKDAREHYRFVTERDCLGTASGTDLVERAAQSGSGLSGLVHRVDCGDCYGKWWSDTPETGAAMDLRHKILWERLLQQDTQESCILVTHSNLIRGLLGRFGNIGRHSERDEESTLILAGSKKLAPCSVIGVRCRYEKVEDVSTGRQNMWIAHEALLMFGSNFEARH